MSIHRLRPLISKEKHALYNVWHWMIKNHTPKNMVCERWLDFWNFVEDVKEKPDFGGDKAYFHRHYFDKPYAPNNYRWRTFKKDAETRAKKTVYMRKWKAKRKETEPNYESDVSLKKMYGITRSFYEDMLLKQGGVCAICKSNESSIGSNTTKIRSLAVDHCHKTGRIRGLLCGACNTGLGLFKENRENMNTAIKYLGGNIT